MEIHVHNDHHHKIYKMNLYSIEENGIGIPDDDENVIDICLDSKYLYETIHDLNIYGDNTRINILRRQHKVRIMVKPGPLKRTL